MDSKSSPSELPRKLGTSHGKHSYWSYSCTPQAARGFSGKIRFQYKTARSSLASVLSSGAAAEGVNRSHRSDGGRGLGGEGCQPLG